MQQQVESLESENINISQPVSTPTEDLNTKTPIASESPSSEEIGSRRKSTRVPEYIYDYAEMLRKEKKVILFNFIP